MNRSATPLAATLFAAFSFSCATAKDLPPADDGPGRAIEKIERCEKGPGEPPHFPPTAFDRFTRCWYSDQLEAMHEPPLWPPSSHETYRFTWLRTFDSPIAARIDATSAHSTVL